MERLKELLPRIIRSFSIPALRSQEKVMKKLQNYPEIKWN